MKTYQLWVLRIIRFITLGIILFLILDPVSKKEEKIIHPSNVIILIDKSMSMSIKDDKQKSSRLKRVKNFLKRDKFIKKELKDNFELQYYSFDKELNSIKPNQVKKLEPDGIFTGIISSIKRIQKESNFGNISGVLLFSDGIENLSLKTEDELSNFSRLNFPIIVYGVGGNYFERDIAITSTEIPEVFYKGEKSRINYDVRYKFLKEKVTKIKIYLDKKLIKEISYTPDKDNLSHLFEDELKFDKEGKFTLKIIASGDFVEENLRNNEIKRNIIIRKPRKKILYIEFNPTWDYTFMKRLLKVNKRVELTTFLFDKKGKIIPEEGKAKMVEEIYNLDFKNFDLIVLGNPSDVIIKNEFFKNLKKAIRNHDSNLLLLIGMVESLPDELESILPFEIKFSPELQAIKFLVSDEGKFHPITRDLVNDNFRTMPDLHTKTELLNVKKGGVVLAQNLLKKDEDGEYAPIWIEHNYGNGKIITLAFSGYWQWQMLASGAELELNFWNRTVERLQRYMIGDKDIRNVAILPLPTVIHSGNKFLLKVRILDEVFLPLNNPEIELVLNQKRNNQPLSVIEVNREKGIFEGEVIIEKPGKYNLILKVKKDEKEIGSDSVAINVEKYNLELENKSINEKLLRKIAYITNGKYIGDLNEEDITVLLNDYSSVENKINIDRIWSNFPFFILIIFLLGLEWYLRKKFGLS
ncbi:VWA domain-containing protein [Candidatus Dependentiae bacterium]|nr:VWA domain-containing protein [Candidatus Dependentiae bacterium]